MCNKYIFSQYLFEKNRLDKVAERITSYHVKIHARILGSYAGNVCEHLFVTLLLMKPTMHSIKSTVMW